MTSYMIGALIALFLYQCFVFVLALVKKDNGIVDVAYGWGFVVIALFTFLVGDYGFAGMLATALAIIWATCLSIRIYLRNQGKPEDFRYASMRGKWGKDVAVNSFFRVFMLQGLIIFIVSLPVSLLNIYGKGLGFSLLAFLGFLVWVKGFVYEVVGDRQLATFMRDPANKGKILDTGLWKYTRHPNYYGEALMWWGLALIAFSVLVPARGFLFALLPFLGPILITYLLLKVSGVPLIEKQFEGNPAWEAYKAKTSTFIPWFLKK